MAVPLLRMDALPTCHVAQLLPRTSPLSPDSQIIEEAAKEVKMLTLGPHFLCPNATSYPLLQMPTWGLPSERAEKREAVLAS